MANKNNMLGGILTDEEYAKIEIMLNNYKKAKDLELEVSFRNINYSTFMRVRDYLVDKTDENNISGQTSLDVSVTLSDGNNYRVSIIDSDNIESFLQKFSKSSSTELVNYLSNVKPSDDIEIMMKDRGSANRLYVDDIATVFKLTQETPITKSGSVSMSPTDKILFRYKNRFSFTMNNFRVDITDVQESRNIRNLTKSNSNYEIEIEAIGSKIDMDSLISNVYSMLQIIQNSDVPVGKKEATMVIDNYRLLLNTKTNISPENRRVISIKAQYITQFIPNRYAVTDKADGDRYFMYVNENGVYLLSINMGVKKTKIIIEDKEFHNMVLDGELIDNEYGRFYLAFDVIYASNVDYRYGDKYNLKHRINVVNHIIDKCFGNLIPFTDYTDEHEELELANIFKFYTKGLKSYWTEFNKQLKGHTGLFVSKKLYFVPYGFESSEVFMYADLIWKLYVYSKLTPYKLDGIIYTPISAPYMIKPSTSNYDAEPLEYKWKPPTQNSIDFYIKFIKDDRGNDAIFYDNAVVKSDANAYKICVLHAGVSKGGKEIPVPFKINGVEQKANIYISDGEAIDIEGNPINDETVVEFIFDFSKPDIDDAFKWTALRTRYDKTEAVQRYGKQYGNNLNIASRIWKTIINPITEENIATLANPSTYKKEIDRLAKTIDNYNNQSYVYYQKKTRNAAGMRAFNNWIKTNMILTYSSGKPAVLDIGCGRGGDLVKFVTAGIDEYVGIDVDNNGLYVISDSAYNRYKSLQKSHTNVPPMYFIQADARALFNVKSQSNVLPNMTERNKQLINTYLSGSKKYNVINAQFTLHYYLSDKLSWTNFCKNINDHLESNGYLLITAFDGKLIYDKLIGNQKMNASYTDNNGNKNVFFEINKIYTDNDTTSAGGIGLAIDVYNSLISNPGTYNREYLVFPEFLEKSLKKECGLELVESDSFFSLFNLYRNYFTGDDGKPNFSFVDSSTKRHEEIRSFYLSLKPNDHTDVESDVAFASFKMSMLNRYYVFKKKKQVDITQASRIVGINHKIDMGKIMMPYFKSNNMIIDPSYKSFKINDVYRNIVNKYRPIKPSVYLIRHSIVEDNIDDITYRRNKIEFIKGKDGVDNKVLILYRSPEKSFYPIYHSTDDNDSGYDNFDNKQSGGYLIDSNVIIDDLQIMAALTKKINNANRNTQNI